MSRLGRSTCLAVDVVVLGADGQTSHVIQVKDDENDGDVRTGKTCTKGAVLATTADACKYLRTLVGTQLYGITPSSSVGWFLQLLTVTIGVSFCVDAP